LDITCYWAEYIMANYAHIEDGQITGVYDLLPINWRNVSNFAALAEDPDTLRQLGWVEVKKVEPEYNEYTQRLGNVVHFVEDGEVIETFEVFNLPAIEPVAPIVITELDIIADTIRRHNEAVEVIRLKRDQLLAATDFTQLPDVAAANGPELTQAYADYRQALRDFPTQFVNDPTFFDANFIVFPEKPTTTDSGTI
jgi:hypothetical protein